MPGVTHDLFVWDTIAVSRRDEPGAQAMRAERFSQRALQSGLGGTLEKDLAHCVSGQPRAFDHATTVDLPEHSGPAVISDCSSQVLRAVTGQVSSACPLGMSISAPSPCESVLERAMSSFKPFLVQATCSTSNPRSSERRNAPAKPRRNTARSRAPARSDPHARHRLRTSAVVMAAARLAGVPCNASGGTARRWLHRPASRSQQVRSISRLPNGWVANSVHLPPSSQTHAA